MVVLFAVDQFKADNSAVDTVDLIVVVTAAADDATIYIAFVFAVADNAAVVHDAQVNVVVFVALFLLVTDNAVVDI